MAKLTIPYLTRKGQSWYWTPGPLLRARGWKSQALGKDQATAEARARALNAEAAADAAPPVPQSSPITIRQLIQRWQASPHFQGVRQRTQRDYAYRCRVVDSWCGQAELEDLTRGLVRDWHRACHRTHAAKANRALQMLRMLYDFAIDHELTAENPADKVKPLAEPRQPVTDWRPAQLAHMIATADGTMDSRGAPFFSIGTALMLNEWAGQRLSDVLLLDADDIGGDGVWRVTQSKTGVTLFLPIGMVPGLAARLAEQRARNRALGYEGSRLMISEATGQPYFDERESTDHFQRRFSRVRQVAAEAMPDCAGLVFQKLRRFAATAAEDAGATEGGLNSIGGWRDGSTASTRYRARTLRQAEGVFEARLAQRERG